MFNKYFSFSCKLVLLGAASTSLLFVVLQLEGVEKNISSYFTSIDGFLFFRWALLVVTTIAWFVYLLRNKIKVRVLNYLDIYEQVVNSDSHYDSRLYAFPQVYTSLMVPLVLIGLVLIYYSVTDTKQYMEIIDEDGLIEYASFAFWFLAAMIGLVSLYIGSVKSKLRTIIYLCLISFFFVCGGEEISWGQRIIGFDAPELMMSINKQQETTLHNIGSISLFANVFFILTVLFFVLIPYLQSKVTSLKIFLSASGISNIGGYLFRIYSVAIVIWIVIGLRFGTLGFHPFSIWGYYTQMDDEAFEFLAAYCFFCYSVLDFYCQRNIQRS